jgi:hypothetical protein
VSGGFSNPLVGGNGALVYPQIMSPNFDLANPGASPNPSWAILKSGLAYFFGLALAGGTITGPDYVINADGAFFYSGAPADGNLLVSIAGSGGTDDEGNAYLAGIVQYDPTGSGNVVQVLDGELNFINTALPSEVTFEINDSGNVQVAGGQLVLLEALAADAGVTFAPISLPSAPAAGVTVWANASGTALQSLNQQDQTGDIPAVITDAGPHTANTSGLLNVSNAYAIKAGDAQPGTVYRITAGGYGVQAGTAPVNLTVTCTAFGVTTFGESIMAAAGVPAGDTFHWRFTCDVVVTGAATARAVSLFTWNQAATGGTTSTAAGGQTSAVDTAISTAAATTIAVQALWASTTNGPSMTGIYSTLERLGP